MRKTSVARSVSLNLIFFCLICGIVNWSDKTQFGYLKYGQLTQGVSARPLAEVNSYAQDTGSSPSKEENPGHFKSIHVGKTREPVVAENCSWSEGEIERNRKKISFISSIDGTEQNAFLISPNRLTGEEAFLVVSLHSWSSDLNQRNELEKLVFERGWYYLFPDFRGPNQRPEACGSRIAQQDILDALDYALKQLSLSPSNVLLTGTSGGGHMTMLMAGLYPDRWRAACSWVGISDLVDWHQKHSGTRYGNMMEKSCGGSPGSSPMIDREYQNRSPIHFISAAKQIPMAFFAGVHDGHQGSVPISQSIRAFNAICVANGDSVVSESEIAELSAVNGRLLLPRLSDLGFDNAIQRDYYLLRRSGLAQLMIFEGGHEGIAAGTMDWFDRVLSN